MTRFNKLASILFASSLISSTTIAQIIRAPTSLSANTGSTSSTPNRLGQLAPDSKGWSDPALEHNRLLISDGTYQVIGNFKVKGSQYLYGQGLSGDIYSAKEKGLDIFISYNTYNQELEFTSISNPDKPLIKEPGDLDSFVIHGDLNLGLPESIKFIYGPLIGTKDKSYYQVIEAGSRFTLYKKYRSELGFDPTNYGQSDLRQFDLVSEYYYTDSRDKGTKKIKPTTSSVIREFKSVKDLSTDISDQEFNSNPEAALRRAFEILNESKKAF